MPFFSLRSLLWNLIIWKIVQLPLPSKTGRVFCTVIMSRCVGCCYPTITGKDFLLFFSGFTHHNGTCFLYFASKCKQLYGLLTHHCWQGLFALAICSVTSNEANMLPFKMGLPSLGVAFSQARYSLVRDSYHQEYS